MGLPILNMDGYLLKQIKAETARANAADAALQAQLNTISGGLIGQEVPTVANGYSIINRDSGGEKFTYWAGQLGDAKGCVDVNLVSSASINSPTYARRLCFTSASIPLPFNDTFNNGKPYLAVLAVNELTNFSGSGILGSEMAIRFENSFDVDTNLSSFDTFSNISDTLFYGGYGSAVGRAGGYAFSPPIFVESAGSIPWNIYFDARAYGSSLTIDDFSYSGSWRDTGQYESGKAALALICKFQQ